jgi:hypothetical protein
MQDTIYSLYQHYADWIGCLYPETISFIIRATLLFSLPCALCYLAFINRSRSTLIQSLCLVAGIMIACSLPFRIPYDPAVKTWVISFCFLLLAFIPGILPLFLTPCFGLQRKLRWFLYGSLLALFIFNLIRN